MKNIFTLLYCLLASSLVAQTPTYRWVSGSTESNDPGAIDITVPSARQGASSFVDDEGNFWLYGGEGFDITESNGIYNDLWRYDKNTGIWVWVSGFPVTNKPEDLPNNSLSFDGIDDEVRLVDDPTDYGANFTVEAYFKPEADGPILSYSPTDENENELGWSIIVANGGTDLWVRKDAFLIATAFNSVDLIDGQWHHVAMVADSDERRIRLYIDGELYEESYNSIPDDLNPNGDHYTYIGSWRGYNTTEYFQGQIDEVRFWDQARTEDEIQSFLSNQITGSLDGVRGYYDFNQGIANSSGNYERTLFDLSGNDFNGELMNVDRAGVFIGRMAEVRVWDNTLSEAQIRSSAKTVLTGGESGLSGAYDFGDVITPEGDNSAVPIISDLTVNGYNGNLTNFALVGSNSNFVEVNLPIISDIYTTPGTSTKSFAEDFTGDGFEDIIINTTDGNSIALFENDQSGGLGAYTEFDVVNRAVDLTVGNFNNDLFLDVAVAAHDSETENRIRVFFGDGAGDFPSFIDIDPGEFVLSGINSADFNGDGFDDMVVLLPVSLSDGFNTGGLDEVRIYYADGAGGFSNPEVFVVGNIYGENIAIGDIDNDTDLDIIYPLFNPPSSTIGTLTNNGDGTFNQETDQRYASQLINKIYMEDINQDGNQDLILSQGSQPGVAFGNGDGTFQNTIFSSVDETYDQYSFIGFNTDNEMEILASHRFENKYYLGTINSNGEYTQRKQFYSHAKPGQIASNDLDDNGFLDYVIPVSNVYVEVLLSENNDFERSTSTFAMDFDGENDFIELPNLGSFENDFTWEAWVNTEDNGPLFSYTRSGEFSDWDEGNPQGFSIAIRNGFLVILGEGVGEVATGGPELRTNSWNHVAVSYNSTIDEAYLFINGVYSNAGTISLNPIATGIDHTAKMGYATQNFKDFLGETAISSNSNWTDGAEFIAPSVGRAFAASWTDDAGIFHIFGGKGVNGIYNGTLQYDEINDTWNLINGTNDSDDLGYYGTQGVSDPLNLPPARWAMQSTKDQDGNIWIFGGAANLDANEWYNDLWKYDPILNEWTWVSGSEFINDAAVYGAQGIGDVTNIPGPRSNHKIWIDAAGDLWIFGGFGFDINGTDGYLNDLWKYSISTGEWTWVSGSSEQDQAGVFGELNEFNDANMPGARSATLQWLDSNGRVWFFGGQGGDKFGITSGYLNDLWSYDPTINQWAWHSGSDFKGSTGSYNEQGLSSVDYVPGARWHGTSWIDSEDNLWLFGGYKYNQLSTSLYNDFWKYEPSTSEWTWLNGYNSTVNLDELGVYQAKNEGTLPEPGSRNGGLEWTDLDGNLWVMGGSQGSSASSGFLNDIWTYNTEKERWTYLLGNTDVEINDGEFGSKGIGTASNEPRSRWHGATWTGQDGKLWFFGGINYNNEINDIAWLNDIWFYDPATNVYTWMGGSTEKNASGVYGIKGEPSTAHIPGARSSTAYWSDSEGNFWMFGGYESFEYNNDLWRYNPNTEEWTWLSGNNFQNSPGIYGEMGVDDPTNSIGARRYMDGRIDQDGNVWVFGGDGHDAEAQRGFLGDLWKYNPTTNIWTWMSGTKFRNQAANFGTKGVASPDNQPPARYGHSMWIDDSGDLWLYGGFGIIDEVPLGTSALSFAGELNDLWKYDVDAGLWTWIDGSDALDDEGVFDVKGEYSLTNELPSRQRALTFKNNDKTLRFFGGRNGLSFNSFWEIKFNPDLPSVFEPQEGQIQQEGFMFSFDEAWTRNYQVQVASSDDFSDVFTDVATSNSTIIVNDLDPGTYYYYRVNSINEIGSSGFTSGYQVLTLPATPEFESLEAAVTHVNATEVSIEWLVGSGMIDGYFIDVSEDPNFEDATMIHEDFTDKDLGLIQIADFVNLKPGTRYYARLRSSNASGKSTYSVTVPFLTLPNTVTYPDPNVGEITQSSASIRWNPVEGEINNYEITISTLDDGFADTDAYLTDYSERSIPSDVEQISIEGLDPGTSYYGLLSAVNNTGKSDQPQMIVILTTPESPVFDPETSINAVTQNSMTITWQPPTGTYDGYQLEVSPDFTFANLNLMVPGYGQGGIARILDASSLTETVPGLVPGRTYFARVRAFNNSGLSPNSNIIEVTTVPRAPTFNDPNNITQSSAAISWSTETGAETYLLDLNTSDNFDITSSLFSSFPTAVPFEVFSNLSPGTRYFARIQSSNGSGNSGDQDPADYGLTTFITIPPTPVLNDPDEIEQTSIRVSWPESQGAAGYQFDVSDNFFQTFLVGYNQVNVVDPEVTIVGLSPGSEYQIRVRSLNGSGQSPNASNFDLLTRPETPIARDATNSSANVFTANWDPSDGADYYILEVSDDDFQSFFYNETLGSSNPVQMTNLTAGSTYKYRVKAGNDSGTSPYSNEISVVAQNTAQSLSISSVDFDEEFEEDDNTALVTVTLTGGTGAPEVTVRYRGLLSTTWSAPIVMNGSGTTFTYEFADFLLDEVGLEFEIYADDNITFVESLGNKIRRSFSESESSELPSLVFSEWQMIAIPYILENNQVTSIFNELASLEYKKQWRLMTYDNESGSYLDAITGFANIEIGTGYWLNVLEETSINVGAGTTNDEIPYPVTLKQGWNQIGNPFNTSVNWNLVLANNNAINVENLYVYDVNQKTFLNSPLLNAFEGAFVWADQETPLDVTPSSFIGRVDEVNDNIAIVNGDDWELPILIRPGGKAFRIAGVGMSSNASDLKDSKDRLAPPRFLNFIEMVTTKQDAIYPYFATDIVSEKPEHRWSFTLSSNHMRGEVTLEWDQVELNKYFGLWMVDERTGRIIDMKSTLSHTFYFNESNDITVHYSTDPNYVVLPQSFSLGDPYPNPVSAETMVPLMLPEVDGSYDIDLSLFDLNGRKVKSLASGPYRPGFHIIEWNAQEEKAITSGIYFYRLTFKDRDIKPVTKKLIIKK